MEQITLLIQEDDLHRLKLLGKFSTARYLRDAGGAKQRLLI